MRISQVAVIPLLDEKNPGQINGRYNEFDVIKSYMQTLTENLEEDRVHFEVVKKDEPIFDNTLKLYLDGGWSNNKKPLSSNGSMISYSDKNSKDLAEHLRTYISDWGKCSVDYNHRIISFSEDKSLCDQPNVTAICITPFFLNGPNHEDYMKKLPELGKQIESCIFEYLLDRQWGPKISGVSYA